MADNLDDKEIKRLTDSIEDVMKVYEVSSAEQVLLRQLSAHIMGFTRAWDRPLVVKLLKVMAATIEVMTEL